MASSTLDLDRAQRLDLAIPADPLSPARFGRPGGLSGWVARLPGDRPVATPAFHNGKLFVGGGYGSFDFYAITAETGELAWRIRTSDDGPTAAVVDEGLVAFNTESCSIIVVRADTGALVWQEWLGDPLMAQPAVAGGRVYVAYPARHERPDLRPGMSPDERKAAIAAARSTRLHEFTHRLLCADLWTGEHLWEQDIPADVITAPIVSGGNVHAACHDGTTLCLDALDGRVLWRRRDHDAAAPVVARGEVYSPRKHRVAGQSREILSGRDVHSGNESRTFSDDSAGHLDRDGGLWVDPASLHALDAGVGFALPPKAAKLHFSADHLGVRSVAGAWAYEGSRPAYADGRLYSCTNNVCRCIDAGTGEVRWEVLAHGSRVDSKSPLFSPPALGRQGVYLCTRLGHILSLDQADGSVRLVADTGLPVAFQPTLAGGRVYAGSSRGLLLCLDAGDADADGWFMWGGNAAHNKTETPGRAS